MRYRPLDAMLYIGEPRIEGQDLIFPYHEVDMNGPEIILRVKNFSGLQVTNEMVSVKIASEVCAPYQNSAYPYECVRPTDPKRNAMELPRRLY